MFNEMIKKNPYKHNGDALVVENINDNSKPNLFTLKAMAVL